MMVIKLFRWSIKWKIFTRSSKDLHLIKRRKEEAEINMILSLKSILSVYEVC